MSWGKVDDGWHDHPKVDKAGLEACGLWGIALSYCCDKLTDGVITRERVVKMAGSKGKANELAKRLCTAVLWHRADEPCPRGHDHCDKYRADEDGFRFHDWEDYQPTREETLLERERKRRNVETHRARKRTQAALGPPPETGSATGRKPGLKSITPAAVTEPESDAAPARPRVRAPDPVSRIPYPVEISTKTQNPPSSAETGVGGDVGFDELRLAVRRELNHEAFGFIRRLGTVDATVEAVLSTTMGRKAADIVGAVRSIGTKASIGHWSEDRVSGALATTHRFIPKPEPLGFGAHGPLQPLTPSTREGTLENFNDPTEEAAS